MKVSLLLFLFILSIAFAQVEDLELESVDDMKLLEEFEDELEKSVGAAPAKAQEDVELDEFEQGLKDELDIANESEDEFLKKVDENGNLDEMHDEELLSDLESEFGDETIKELDIDIDAENLDEEFETIAKQTNMEDDLEMLDDLEDLDTIEFKEEPSVLYETLAEKQQKQKDLMEELTILQEKKARDFIKENQARFTKEARYTIQQVEALKRQLKDIAVSPTKYGYMPRNTRVIDLKTNKKYKLARGITVKAHIMPDYNKYRYIVDTQGNLRYKTFYSNIGNLREITNLYTPPHHFSRIKKVKKISRYDGRFKYSVKFNLHGGLSINRFTKDIVGDSENYSPMVRTELGFLTRLKLPVKVGMSGMYESITGRLSSGGRFSTKIFSLGPTLMKQNIFNDYNFIFQPRISIFANMAEARQDETRLYRINDTSVLMGFERPTNLKFFGRFVLGANFQRKWLRTRGKKEGFNINPNVTYDDSFAFYIGHQSDWLW